MISNDDDDEINNNNVQKTTVYNNRLNNSIKCYQPCQQYQTLFISGEDNAVTRIITQNVKLPTPLISP